MSEDVPPLHCRLIAFPVGRNRGEGSVGQRQRDLPLRFVFEAAEVRWGKVAVFAGVLSGLVPRPRMGRRVTPFVPADGAFFRARFAIWAETTGGRVESS